jgi:hypothetical protein
MEFQITQNYGGGTKGFIYFETDEVSPQIDFLKRLAIKAMNDDWESINPALYFSAPEPPKPTIYVAEYKDGKKVKGGIQFKCKWR